MKERIKELWYQAVQPHTGDSWAEQTAFMEEFAVLIVKECAKVVFEKTGPKSALDVLEHFGVEE